MCRILRKKWIFSTWKQLKHHVWSFYVFSVKSQMLFPCFLVSGLSLLFSFPGGCNVISRAADSSSLFVSSGSSSSFLFSFSFFSAGSDLKSAGLQVWAGTGDETLFGFFLLRKKNELKSSGMWRLCQTQNPKASFFFFFYTLFLRWSLKQSEGREQSWSQILRDESDRRWAHLRCDGFARIRESFVTLSITEQRETRDLMRYMFESGNNRDASSWWKRLIVLLMTSSLTCSCDWWSIEFIDSDTEIKCSHWSF